MYLILKFCINSIEMYYDLIHTHIFFILPVNHTRHIIKNV